ncbi:MAG: lipopolysaccharide biosynthesis protein [Deltaproteobacteria bacterium]
MPHEAMPFLADRIVCSAQGLAHRGLPREDGYISPGALFARNVSMLAGSRALAYVVVLAASPILTRLYTPEDFGVLAVFVAILGLMLTIASWRYEIAIPLPRDEAVAANLLTLTLIILAGMSALFSVGMVFVGEKLIVWTKTPALRPYLWLLPVSLAAAGLYQVFNYWALRRKAFTKIAHTRLAQGLGTVASQLSIGLAFLGPLGLLVGDAVGRAAGSGTLASLVWREREKIFKQVTRRGMIAAAQRYRRFPLLSGGSGLLNTGGLILPPLLLAAFYGPAVAGLFALAMKVICMPTVLLGEAVGQVFMSEGTRTLRESPEDLGMLFRKTATVLLLVGPAPICLSSFIAPQAFALVFGESWRAAGEYARFLAFPFAASFVVNPLTPMFDILERQDWELAWVCGRLALVVGGLFAAHALGFSARSAVMIYSATMLIGYLANLTLVAAAVRSHNRTLRLRVAAETGQA